VPMIMTAIRLIQFIVSATSREVRRVAVSMLPDRV